jgi:hypothetical protein
MDDDDDDLCVYVITTRAASSHLVGRVRRCKVAVLKHIIISRGAQRRGLLHKNFALPSKAFSVANHPQTRLTEFTSRGRRGCPIDVVTLSIRPSEVIPQILRGIILMDKQQVNHNHPTSKASTTLEDNTHSNSVPQLRKPKMRIRNLFKRRGGYGMKTSYPHLHLSSLVNPTHPLAAYRVKANPAN